MPEDAIGVYLKAVEEALAAGNATEHTYRPALKGLLEALVPGLTATNEPRRAECGAPDYVVSQNHPHGPLTIGYVEAKDVGEPLAEAEKSAQLWRYRAALPSLILTDYLEFRWYVDGERRLTTRLATVEAHGKFTLEPDGAEAVRALLTSFLTHAPQAVAKPRDLAERLARLTHMVSEIIVTAFNTDRASAGLRDLRGAFAKTLIPDLEEPRKAGEFADMYAQTIAYGLFAARCQHPVGVVFRRQDAAREIPKTNPFLRTLFNTLTGPDMDDEPYAGFVDDIASLLNHTDMASVLEDFGKRTHQEDPVVHFYETFLAAYDPKLRKARGVYYTPEPVVSYIVRSVDHLLKTRFDCANGLADEGQVEYAEGDTQAKCPRVLVLDPACGTGTFLYAVVDHIRREFTRRGDAGMWSGYVRRNLLPRLFGFELLMAPYAVAHLKLGMQLAGLDLPAEERKKWAYDFAGDERLGVYLTNTLEDAEKRAEGLFGPLRVISEEANGAASIKRAKPIMVVMGNPPYSGHSANRSWQVKDGKRLPTFIGRLVQDYYAVNGHALGERNPKWLQDDYVKFIRWGCWRVERTGAGILAFITNHGYLDNPTFRGMRQRLMEVFDELYILNLHGNAKKRETAPDGTKDENVFDIQQGVAIGIFVRTGRPRTAPAAFHTDLWGIRARKLAFLAGHEVSTTRWTKLSPRSPAYLLHPTSGHRRREYERGWNLSEAMPLSVLGFQTHRDSLAVDADRDRLEARLRDLRSTQLTDECLREKYAIQESRHWSLSQARAALRRERDLTAQIAACAYRPFDKRWCYFGEAVCDRPRTELRQHVLGKPNLCLNLVRQTKAAAWRHVAVSREPTPAVFVEVKDGSSVFPLYLYPNGDMPDALFEHSNGRRPNLAKAFVEDVTSGVKLRFIPEGIGDLKRTVGPEDILHYIYAILHSDTYRTRYAEFLTRDFPRVPLTANVRLFRRLCNLGGALVALHLLESPRVREWVSHYPIPGSNVVDKGYPRYLGPGATDPASGRRLTAGRVYINQGDRVGRREAQYFDGVPPEIWDFHVGGYQVCDKWLRDRQGRGLSFDDLSHYQKVVAALGETIRVMEEIDAAIPHWPL